MSEGEPSGLGARVQEVAPEVLEQLVPQLPGIKRRLGVGLVVILLASIVGVGLGKGYVVADPLSADFEVQEAVVSSFGNGDDVYVQFAIPNRGRRDIQLDRVYHDNGLNPRVAALAGVPETIPELGIFWGRSSSYADGVPSILNYVGSRRDLGVNEDPQSFAGDLTSNLVELPVTVAGDGSIIVALIVPARRCGESAITLDSIAAEVRFASIQRLSPTRTERFDFADDVDVWAVKETGEIAQAADLNEAICGVVG